MVIPCGSTGVLGGAACRVAGCVSGTAGGVSAVSMVVAKRVWVLFTLPCSLLWFRIAYACPATASLCNIDRVPSNSRTIGILLTCTPSVYCYQYFARRLEQESFLLRSYRYKLPQLCIVNTTAVYLMRDPIVIRNVP